MRHRIIHDTFYTYESPVLESVMEVRLHPASNARQKCEQYSLSITPKTAVHTYVDAAHNIINHFQIPGALTNLHVRAESTVEVFPVPALPVHVSHADWDAYGTLRNTPLLDYMMSSTYVRTSALLDQFLEEHQISRLGDPLTIVRQINEVLYRAIQYTPESTTVDTTIDEVLLQRKGVCQDISHLMLGMCRRLGIPARYVSGYLYHRTHDHDRSQTDATHAWVDVWFPGYEWVGFDPTNNILATERHIVVATGRDYADVSPTRGVYRGETRDSLGVSVRINDDTTTAAPLERTRPSWPDASQQQEQQQQQ